MLLLSPYDLQANCKKTAVIHLSYLSNYLENINTDQKPNWVFKINKNILNKTIKEIVLNNQSHLWNSILILPWTQANLLCVIGLLVSLHQSLEKNWQSCSETCLQHIRNVSNLIRDFLPCWFPYQIETTFVKAHFEKVEKKTKHPLGSLASIKPLAVNLCSYTSSIYLANYLPQVNYINIFNVRSHKLFSQLFYHELAHFLLACRKNKEHCVPSSFFQLNNIPLEKSYQSLLVESFCDSFSLFVRGELEDKHLASYFEGFLREEFS